MIKFLIFLVFMSVNIPVGFKTEQKKFKRVREAYAEKESLVKALLANHSIQLNQVEIYLRAFKSEKELELWGRNKGDRSFQLLKTYSIC